MRKKQFISALTELIPGCTRESAKMWTQFATENVREMDQYVDFAESNPAGKNAAIEDWLDSIYAGIAMIKQRFNDDVATQIANLGSIPYCVYPGEMYATAQQLVNGAKPEDMHELNEKGMLEWIGTDDWPMFPKLEMLSDGASDEELGGITMQ